MVRTPKVIAAGSQLRAVRALPSDDQLDAVSDAISDELVSEHRAAPTDWSETMNNTYEYSADSLRVFLTNVATRLRRRQPSYNLPNNQIGPLSDANWNKSVDDLRTATNGVVS